MTGLKGSCSIVFPAEAGTFCVYFVFCGRDSRWSFSLRAWWWAGTFSSEGPVDGSRTSWTRICSLGKEPAQTRAAKCCLLFCQGFGWDSWKWHRHLPALVLWPEVAWRVWPFPQFCLPTRQIAALVSGNDLHSMECNVPLGVFHSKSLNFPTLKLSFHNSQHSINSCQGQRKRMWILSLSM